MFSDLSWLGILCCVYALSRLLHYVCLRLEDTGKHPFLQKILMVICFILWILSAPVAIVFGILNTMHFRRLEDVITKDCAKDPSSHDSQRNASIPLEIICVLLVVMVIGSAIYTNTQENKIEELEAQIEELSYEYDSGYDDGYDSGHSIGYDDGYSDGYGDANESSYDDGYDDGFQDGYSNGQAEGYEEGYYLGYSGSVVDFADDSTELEFLTKMLNTPSDDEDAFYHELYEWVIDWRYKHFGR